jgi:hypothetical protein
MLGALKILHAYHREGISQGGISPGLIKKGSDGRIYYQDPLMLNHISKSLQDRYQVDPVPESIGNDRWDPKADLFSWGVLAYRWLTGIDPFQAKTLPARLEKISRVEINEPRNLQPLLSPEMNRLLMSCLAQKPENRPNPEQVLNELEALVAAGHCTLSDAETEGYREDASRNLKRFGQHQKMKELFRRYYKATLVGLLILAVVIYITMAGQRKNVITEKTTPYEVATIYYYSVGALNVPLMRETVYGFKNGLEDITTQMYVNSRMQNMISGLTRSKEKTVAEVTGLKIDRLNEGKSGAAYRAAYTLSYYTPVRIDSYQRIDRLTLRPVGKIWRITGIKNITSKHTQKKVIRKPEPRTDI